MNKIKNSVLELLPIIIALIAIIFLKKEIEILIIVLLVTLVSFKISYHKGEVYVFLLGCIMGVILEFFGNIRIV